MQQGGHPRRRGEGPVGLRPGGGRRHHLRRHAAALGQPGPPRGPRRRSRRIGSGVYLTAKNDYTDVLPSMNITLEPRDNVILRGGIAKVMARPTLSSLTPGGTVVGATARTVNFGNPELEPFRAANFDLAAEWYFAKEFC
ncbi:TonB-dependent receptor domain-containing protein [Caulobacter segnis]